MNECEARAGSPTTTEGNYERMTHHALLRAEKWRADLLEAALWAIATDPFQSAHLPEKVAKVLAESRAPQKNSQSARETAEDTGGEENDSQRRQRCSQGGRFGRSPAPILGGEPSNARLYKQRESDSGRDSRLFGVEPVPSSASNRADHHAATKGSGSDAVRGGGATPPEPCPTEGGRVEGPGATPQLQSAREESQSSRDFAGGGVSAQRPSGPSTRADTGRGGRS